MSKKAWLYVAFFTALVFIFYFLVKDYLGTGSSSKLAVIVEKVPDFSFRDQDNKEITQYSTDGNVYVAEYFFTTCKSICPRMNANMRRVYDRYKDQPNFMILSHSCMPEVDSVPLLKAYEKWMLDGRLVQKPDGSYRIEKPADSALSSVNKNWHFLTGDKKALYDMARHGYMIDNGKPDTLQVQDQFMHTQFFALVDRQKRVRGIYDGLKEAEVQALMHDIQELLNEKTTRSGFSNGFSSTPN